MKGMRGMLAAAVTLLCAAAGATGQESVATLVVPGDGTLALGRLEPFSAEYEQVGVRMHVRLSRTGGEVPTWDFAMQMPSAGGGAAIDHVTHRADDLAFFRRRFGFGAFRDEFIDASVRDGMFRLHRLVEEGDPVAPATMPTDGALVDGTFLYWALGLLPLDEEHAFRFPTWSPTAESFELRESGVLTVGPHRRVEFEGETLEATVVSAETPSGTVEMVVTPHPPYLISQEIVAPDGSRSPIIRLVSVERSADASDRAAIGRASAAFSAAYMAGDTATVRSLYVDDGLLLPPGRDIRGGAAIARYFAPVTGREVIGHRMSSESLRVDGDVAIDIGTWHQSTRRADGVESSAEGRYVVEWVRGLDGRWRIRTDMWHRPAPGGD